MGESSTKVETRLAVADRLHQLSYQVVAHYDSKTNQLLTIIGIDFAVVGFILAGFFSNIEKLALIVRISVLVFSSINFLLASIALWHIISALTPHLAKVGKRSKSKADGKTQQVKPKLGLTYFKDILENFSEEEYVRIFLGQKLPPKSPYVDKKMPQALLESLIEDDCRDIYAHAEILEVKTTAVKNAFKWVFLATVVLFITTIILGIIYASAVPNITGTTTTSNASVAKRGIVACEK